MLLFHAAELIAWLVASLFCGETEIGITRQKDPHIECQDTEALFIMSMPLLDPLSPASCTTTTSSSSRMTLKIILVGVFLLNSVAIWTMLGRCEYYDYTATHFGENDNASSSARVGHPPPLESHHNNKHIPPRKQDNSKLLAENTFIENNNHNGSRPILPTHNRNHPSHDEHKNKKILVVYSGPTSLNTTIGGGFRGRDELYVKNFDYFLHHGGVDCQRHDTVLVVTEEVYVKYHSVVQAYAAQHCQTNASLKSTQTTNQNHFVKLVIRENVCFDMESVRLVLRGHVDGVNVSTYDYFIYANCGTTGPAPRSADHESWTDAFVQRFDNRVRMVGVSHNCFHGQPHIQSIAYALDKQGIQLILKSRAVYDCRLEDKSKGAIINRYEIGMSRYLMTRGHAVRSILRNTTLTNFTGPCEGLDIWMTHRLMETYGGRLPSLNETIFYKTSRVLTEEIAQLINWTRPITGNW